MTCVCFNYVDATVKYEDDDHTVSESDGSVVHVLVLSRSLPYDVDITINTIRGNTAGELCTVAMNC